VWVNQKAKSFFLLKTVSLAQCSRISHWQLWSYLVKFNGLLAATLHDLCTRHCADGRRWSALVVQVLTSAMWNGLYGDFWPLQSQ